MMATSYDYPYFKTPCSIIVAGPSQCGKTTLTRHLLRSASHVTENPNVVSRTCSAKGSISTGASRKTSEPCSPNHVMLWVCATWRSRCTLDASRMSWTVFKMPPVNRTGTCSLISIPPHPIYFVFERIF